MTKLSLLIAAGFVASVAVGQAKKPPTKIKCAVMPTMDVDIAKATKDKMFKDYKGKRYYFCCGGCPPAFAKNPEKYAKNPSLPIPKSAPKK